MHREDSTGELPAVGGYRRLGEKLACNAEVIAGVPMSPIGHPRADELALTKDGTSTVHETVCNLIGSQGHLSCQATAYLTDCTAIMNVESRHDPIESAFDKIGEPRFFPSRNVEHRRDAERCGVRRKHHVDSSTALVDVVPDSRKICQRAECREGRAFPFGKGVSAFPEPEFVRLFGGSILIVMAGAGYL